MVPKTKEVKETKEVKDWVDQLWSILMSVRFMVGVDLSYLHLPI